MNDIGKQIAKLRKNKGYTQEALAGILNVSSQASPSRLRLIKNSR